MTADQTMRWLIKPAVFILCLGPLAYLAWGVVTFNLGANPVDEITDRTGEWTLRFLLITLTVTPLRRLTGWNRLVRLRRMLGLFAFFYACLHFTTYIWLDQWFLWSEMLPDIAERPFITVGFSAFLLLIPLAVTSTNAMMRRLGRNWQRLHRLVYVIAALGVLHYLWLVKKDLTAPLVYATLLGILLLYRVFTHLRTQQTTRRTGWATR